MIFVSGATGSVGRHVLAALAGGREPVRAMTRNAAAAVFPAEVEVVQGDLAQPERLGSALRGVRAVYLMAMGGAAERFVTVARQAGVRRIVLLSSDDVHDGAEVQPDAVARIHAEFEQAVIRSGLEWTVLRPNEFAGNRLHWAHEIRASGVVRAPCPKACTVPIHERDIAAVAVRALVEDGHHGATYRLTGPHAITHAEQLDQIGAVLGRALRFEEITPQQARAAMVRYAPALVVDAVLEQLAATVDDPPAPTATVLEVIGRPARTFTEWVRDHVAAFA